MKLNDSKRAETITLCGSTKFKEEFEAAAKNLSLNGYIVLMPHIFAHALGLKLDKEEKENFDRLHKQKIDMSDSIMVINKDGYIGESTKEEIEYAKSKGKKVYYRYMECETDCVYNINCRAKQILPPFEKMFSNKYPTCLCYCEEDK